MKNLVKSLLYGALALFGAGSAVAQNYRLVWQDEFNGNQIANHWGFETGGGGWGNNELQYYRRENAKVENGALVITAKRQDFGGRNYTSARMRTGGAETWKYGKIEARIAMPAFNGIWPAFWMLGDSIGRVGWPDCGEIDIMEHTNTGGNVFGTIHWSDQNGQYATYGLTTQTPSVTNYNTYSIEWDENRIQWFINGNRFHEVSIRNGVNGTSEFHEKFFIILNLAVGGNFPGFNIDNSGFDARMLVDYVRVYQIDNSTPPPPPSNTPIISGKEPLFMLVNRNSGKSLDLIGGNQNNGARISQWSFDYNGPNQRWFIRPTENSNHFRIISAVSGKCLCVVNDSNADAARVHAYTYTGNNPAQQWDFVYSGDGYYRIRNVKSGKVLDVSGFSTANNANLEQYRDNNTSNQQWKIQPCGDYYIRSISNRYIAVQNSGNANGSNVIQYQGEQNPWFRWHLQGVDNGWLRCNSLHSFSRVIGPKSGSQSNGAQAHIWQYNPANYGDQKVRIQPLPNGRFKFYYAHVNKAWDFPRGQNGNNVALEQYTPNGNDNQEFVLTRN